MFIVRILKDRPDAATSRWICWGHKSWEQVTVISRVQTLQQIHGLIAALPRYCHSKPSFVRFANHRGSAFVGRMFFALLIKTSKKIKDGQDSGFSKNVILLIFKIGILSFLIF